MTIGSDYAVNKFDQDQDRDKDTIIAAHEEKPKTLPETETKVTNRNCCSTGGEGQEL